MAEAGEEAETYLQPQVLEMPKELSAQDSSLSQKFLRLHSADLHALLDHDLRLNFHLVDLEVEKAQNALRMFVMGARALDLASVSKDSA